MQRLIVQQFRNGLLSPNSELQELKYIGPYLYKRLINEFDNTRNTLTIRRFSQKIFNMSINTLKHKLQKALQNRRNNQCIRNGTNLYHVPDFNEKGYEVMINLIKVMDRNLDGYGLGNRFTFDSRLLRKPPKRQDQSVSCKARNTCNNRGIWINNLCIPTNSRTRGFPGVFPYSGQKTYKRSRNNALGSIHNSIRRGQYVNDSRNVYWRKPGRMPKIL